MKKYLTIANHIRDIDKKTRKFLRSFLKTISDTLAIERKFCQAFNNVETKNK